MNIIKYINVALKGFGMGAANVVPGVSGGTIALLTGIYTKIIDSLNALTSPEIWKLFFKGKFRSFWKEINGTFLISLLIGVLISIVSLAKFMDYTIVYYPVQTWAFFFGLIVASSIYMLVDIKNWQLKDVIWLIIGGILGVLICTLSPTQTPNKQWFIFICGVIAICTMILPGISGSFILVILGKYKYLMSAVNNGDTVTLIVFVIGCGIGILAFARFLKWILNKAERQTMLVLIGFVIGSLIKVWPWNNMTEITTAHFLQLGQNIELATNNTKALIATGLPLKNLIDMNYMGAFIWAIIGAILVIALEMLRKNKSI